MAQLPRLSIRGGNGIGDAIYVYGVVKHYLAKGHEIEVCTRWPEIFSQLPVECTKFRRDRITNLAHYTTRKGIAGTSQYRDVCINAGIKEDIPWDFGWKPVNTELFLDIRRRWPKPVVAVAMPRNPMGRTDGFGKEILPVRIGYQRVLDALKARAYLIMIGAGPAIYKLDGCHWDLCNKTTLTDMLDVATAVDGFFGFCSNFVPLAEAQSKPALFVWARANINSRSQFVSRITPQKILHRGTSGWVFDDQPDDAVEAAVCKFIKAMAPRDAEEWQGTGQVPTAGGIAAPI